MAQSVQSGMNFKLPITLKFPSFYDIMRPVRNVAVAAAANEPVTAGSKQREEEDNQRFLNETRAQSRALFYKSIERTSSKWGEGCLLRAICEVAEIPAINSGSGLLGELIDMFLT